MTKKKAIEAAMKYSPEGFGNTRVGAWLRRHGWVLNYVEPHGFSTAHYWRSPHDGKLYTQTYALIEQRSINKKARAK